jgi:hypothetical protein
LPQTEVRPSQDGSINIEQFALGVLAVYALNIGALTILICFVPFGLFFGGVVLTELGFAPKPADAGAETTYLTAIAVLVCLFMLSGVGGLFYWGVRSILMRKSVQAIIFLALLLAAPHNLISRIIAALIVFDASRGDMVTLSGSMYRPVCDFGLWFVSRPIVSSGMPRSAPMFASV